MVVPARSLTAAGGVSTKITGGAPIFSPLLSPYLGGDLLAAVGGETDRKAADGSQPLAYTTQVEVSWDEAKNLANQRKHGVSFEEAKELFVSGDDYLEIFDEAHSEIEDRFIAVGPISRGIILVVWTERDEDALRIISARWATRNEQDLYQAYRDERR